MITRFIFFHFSYSTASPELHRRSIRAECFDVEEREDSEVYTVKDSPECTSISMNTILSGTEKTVEELTSEYFNGETYKVGILYYLNRL